MIVRRKSNINPDATEVSLQISYGTPDIKDIMRFFCYGSDFECRGEIHFGSIGWQVIDVAKKEDVFREAQIREWVECSIHVFGNYEERWRKQLSAWFLRQCLKMRYFVQSEADPTCFYFGSEGMKLMQKRLAAWDKSQE